MINRKITLGLLAGLLIAGSAVANDRGHRMDRHQMRGGQDVGMQVLQHLGKAMRRLDLSEDQKLAIKDEFGGVRETLKPLMQELHAGRRDLRDLVASGEYDADTAAEIADHQGQITADITLLVSEAVPGVMTHLTDEQRAELQAMGEERQARKQERREKFRAHKEERRERRGGDNPDGN